jgi:hypothetical protein
MQKRGQIYLLAALIIGFILFTLAAQVNVVKKTVIEDDFEELSKNYERESARFVNDLIKIDSPNIDDQFRKFTVLFTSFSKTKNPEFGLVYVFLHEGTIYIGNYLENNILITSHSPPKHLKGCFKNVEAGFSVAGLKVSQTGINFGTFSTCTFKTTQLPSGNIVVLEINDIAYEISLSPNNPEIMIVSREEKAQQRKVFLKGNFIKGREA